MDIFELIPKKTKFKLRKKFLFFSGFITYKIREYCFRDKIYFCNKYGQEQFLKLLSSPDGVDFEKTYFEIVYRLASTTNENNLFEYIRILKFKLRFKTLDKFINNIKGYDAEAAILIAGLESIGLSTKPTMTDAEIKDMADDLKKKQTASQ